MGSVYLSIGAHVFLDRSNRELSDLHGKRVSMIIAKFLTAEEVIKNKISFEIAIEGTFDPLHPALTL